MAYEDKTLTCRDCSKEFVWTASEQEFYASKGFDNPPSRCPEDRAAHKNARMSERQMFDITCSNCGKAAQVPFEPKGDKPVYCSDCFKEQREKKD